MNNLFTFYTPANAQTPAKEMMQKINADYGFIPNLFGYMAEAPATIEAYLFLNELIGKSSLGPKNAQLSLWITSIENQCEFCQMAHQAFAKKFGVKEQTYSAVLTQAVVKCPIDTALINFTRALVKKRGHLNEAEVHQFLEAGFTRQQIMEVIMIVTIKTLSNYINHLTRPAINPEIKALL